tara:strand:+ start:150 stop:479 length:330 start_codon:yes stop_codon:yes gene_type:complete
MAFKLKPLHEVLGHHKESKLGEAIKYQDMPKDVAGYIDMNKTIFINRNMPKKIQDKALKHEKVHRDQIKSGDLKFDDNAYVFKGKKYLIKKLNMNSKSLPWEKSAYKND